MSSLQYLTKERLNRAVKNGIKEAAVRAKAKVGVIVVVEDGWIVNKHKDGVVERLDKVQRPPSVEIEKKIAQLTRI
ncbi:MAG: hypothetical protein LBF16_15240 [Pseudomonadales bacterium]|jgi:hypothetical protein|nr:hypothetical protein [Pseudomonadales bacterium]